MQRLVAFMVSLSSREGIARAAVPFMVSLSNHEGVPRTVVRRFMVRQAHHEAIPGHP